MGAVTEDLQEIQPGEHVLGCINIEVRRSLPSCLCLQPVQAHKAQSATKLSVAFRISGVNATKQKFLMRQRRTAPRPSAQTACCGSGAGRQRRRGRPRAHPVQHRPPPRRASGCARRRRRTFHWSAACCCSRRWPCSRSGFGRCSAHSWAATPTTPPPCGPWPCMAHCRGVEEGCCRKQLVYVMKPLQLTTISLQPELHAALLLGACMHRTPHLYVTMLTCIVPLAASLEP